MTTNHTTYSDLEADLRERWLPTEMQRKRAEALLRTMPPGDHVYTGHLLLNKEYGFWTMDVKLIALDGVFVDRMSCQEWVATAARTYHDQAGVKLTGGWSTHHLDRDGNEQAAVFEDIMARWPKD